MWSIKPIEIVDKSLIDFNIDLPNNDNEHDAVAKTNLFINNLVLRSVTSSEWSTCDENGKYIQPWINKITYFLKNNYDCLKFVVRFLPYPHILRMYQRPNLNFLSAHFTDAVHSKLLFLNDIRIKEVLTNIIERGTESKFDMKDVYKHLIDLSETHISPDNESITFTGHYNDFYNFNATEMLGKKPAVLFCFPVVVVFS